MAKTLKFNLRIDKDIQVRTLEDLRNNFVLEDILAYYNNKLLHKWLRARGFTKELVEVDELETKYKIPATSEKEILAALIRIFDIDEDEVLLQDYLDKVKLERQRELERKKKAEVVSSEKLVVNNYFDGYDRLCEEILSSPSKTKIQKGLDKIAAHYQRAFVHGLYHFVINADTLTLLCLLMNPFTRKFFMDTDEEKGVKDTFKDIMGRMSSSLLDQCDGVQKFSKRTGSGFELVTEKECLVIVIFCTSSAKCTVAEANTNYKGTFDRHTINGKFRILKGLKVHSNNIDNNVYYIEI